MFLSRILHGMKDSLLWSPVVYYYATAVTILQDVTKLMLKKDTMIIIKKP